jgi:hypothetical protein
VADAIADKIVAVHLSLDAAGLPHAFGGALALAWCTAQARGTIDIDVNVFAPATDAASVIDALPRQVVGDEPAIAMLRREGQARLWWGSTPVDVFLDTTPFHAEVALRVRTEPFAGHEVPFLGCNDLAVFKAFFDRTKDWADLEEMHAAGTLDAESVVGVLVHHLGASDHRVARLLALSAAEPPTSSAAR